MPKCGQFKTGAAWVGGKEPDLLPSGNLRFYDKRCRTRIIMGAIVKGKIAKNSIFRRRPGNGYYGAKKGTVYQDHFRYYNNIGAPGSALEAGQTLFRQAMNEIKVMTEEQKTPYKALSKKNYDERGRRPGSYKARAWPHYYLMERLPQLYHP